MNSSIICAPCCLFLDHQIKDQKMGQKCGAYGREEDRQITYKRNIKARSHNHFSRRKVISMTLSVALIIQHAKHKRRIILICGLSGSTLFFHIIS